MENNNIYFPNPNLADDDGLVAVGGKLSPEYLLAAYSQGIFPWFNENDPILWWSPNPRMVLFPDNFKISASFRQILKKKNYVVKIDHDFKTVIEKCSTVKRKGQTGTWITKGMIEAYIKLHMLGYAHSFETYYDGKLAGGLYGVSLGQAFFGESMFHLKSDASKIALHALVEFSLKNNFYFIDAQQSTEHLKSLGGQLLSREEFLLYLRKALEYKTMKGKWNS